MNQKNDDLPVTQLLAAVQAGEADAWDRLLARVYRELHVLARHAMAKERAGNLLQTTALVNEAYLRLVRTQAEPFKNHGQFFRAAASAMRRILIDEARRRRVRDASVAGARSERVFGDGTAPDPWTDQFLADLEALNGALTRFEQNGQHAQKARVIELRYFAGLTIEQTSEVLGVSSATVKRDWEFARTWLKRELDQTR
ncbi:MAG: ECF-type sigma factor [Planctomycetota bacterium]